MNEDSVTKSIAVFLAQGQWSIESINSPFSGRSVWIKPIGGRRGKGALIPDVIATKGGELVIVESSVPYRVSDECKLLCYLEPAYLKSICTMFESREVSSIALAVGLSHTDLHRVVSSEVTVFAVDESLTVGVHQAGTRVGICGCEKDSSVC